MRVTLCDAVIDLIFPPRCRVCGEFLEGDRTDGVSPPMVCATCFEGFRRVDHPLCPVCGIPFPPDRGGDHLCGACLRKRPFYDAAGAPFLFEGPVMTAVHRFKYGQREDLSRTLGSLLAEFAGRWVGEPEEPVAVPVPLHPRRLRERGFNQSALLARHVARGLGAKLDLSTLRRTRYTAAQTGLGKDERRKNVRGAFLVIHPSAVKGRTVLLVDDVLTTGNTLNQCARALRRAGARRVLCLVFARAGMRT